jgi:hypothetical protein
MQNPFFVPRQISKARDAKTLSIAEILPEEVVEP